METVADKRAQRALIAATLAFAACFSVWTLYAVMGLKIHATLDLTVTEYGFLLAAPMLTGSLLRFPIGFLTERYSGRKLFITQMLLVTPPLFLLPLADSYPAYVILGLILGVSGVSFTIGIRYVTQWFARQQQGFAMGVFGAGNAGAAVTFVMTPLVDNLLGWEWIGPAYGIGMLLVIVLFVAIAPEEPRTLPAVRPGTLREQLQPLRDLKVWRFSLYYYFVFGSFLAMLMWLPHYYVNAYGLDIRSAMLLTLLFVSLSSMVRALGGWFSDRYGGRAVNWSVFWICLVCLFFLSYPPTDMIIHGVSKDVHLRLEINVWVFTLLIIVIGLAQGFGRASVFKIIHDYYPSRMGSVGGTVAALGATGGFTLPVLFGVAVELLGIHSACFMVLYGVLAVCMMVMYLAIQNDALQTRLQKAIEQNFLQDE
jgi:NNP family nitrate/nitrite transporter-like MFS transporter